MTEPRDASEIDPLAQSGAVLVEKYVIQRRLGSGGMGVVLEAWHSELEKPVAIKLLKELKEEHVARFFSEARVAASLESEHVARVLDVGTAPDGRPFIVLEYLDGSNLAEVLYQRARLSAEVAVDYVLQACDAIAEAHLRGVVHRDLKPANLFLARRRDGGKLVKVLDFGISKAQKMDRAVTATGSLLGTPLYMSPEQVQDPRSADTRSDIWALGVILHELLTGELPFEGESLPALGAAIVAGPPRSIRDSIPDAVPDLEAVILRCLAKDPSRRYQSVAELARALQPFAPAHARHFVERINALVAGGAQPQLSADTRSSRSEPAKATAETVAASAVSAPVVGKSETLSATTSARSAGWKAPAWAVVVTGIGVAAVVVVLLAKHSAPPAAALEAKPAASSAPAPVVEARTAPPEPVVEPAPSESTAPDAAVAASASPSPKKLAHAPSPKAAATKSAAPVAAKKPEPAAASADPLSYRK
jgi:eukaryotic-like serine/threonine-protein kinase